MGDGWSHIVSKLRKNGFETTYYKDFEPETYVSLMPRLDYYLYMGEDEGSMVFVDAVFCGVKTIATAQGFHIDAQNGLTHRFSSFDELVAIFQNIQNELQTRRNSVKDWTWRDYAIKHIELWEYLKDKTQPNTQTYHDGLNSLLNKTDNPLSKEAAWQAIQKTDKRLRLAE